MIAGANFVDICGNDSGCVYMYRNTNLGYWEQMDKIASRIYHQMMSLEIR